MYYLAMEKAVQWDIVLWDGGIIYRKRNIPYLDRRRIILFYLCYVIGTIHYQLENSMHGYSV